MNRNLHSLLFGIWAIRPEYAIAYTPQVLNLLRGERGPIDPKELEALRAQGLPTVIRMDGMDADEPLDGQSAEPASTVMRIPIQGAITKYGGMCNYGAIDYANWMAHADADDSIVGIVLDIDSGGGSGNGMNLLTDRMRRVKKPIVAITQSGMACSAAFGIGAHADEFYALLKTDEFGSVGTLTTLPNMKKYWASQGLDLHDVYASRSTDKNSAWMEALKADQNDPNDPHYKQLREEFLDPFNEAFIADMKAARPAMAATEKEWSTGKVFGADEAKALGLIDGYTTMEGAIERIRELSKTKGSASTGTGTAHSNSNTNPAASAAAPEVGATAPTNDKMNIKEKAASLLAGMKNFFTSDEDVNAQTVAAANAALKAEGFSTVEVVTTARLAEVEASETKVSEAEARASAAEELATKSAADIEAQATELATASEALAAKETALAEATTKVSELETSLATVKAEVEAKDVEIAKLKDQPADDGQPNSATGAKGDADPSGKGTLSAEELELKERVSKDLADMP